jgi:hypothetical protein
MAIPMSRLLANAVSSCPAWARASLAAMAIEPWPASTDAIACACSSNAPTARAYRLSPNEGWSATKQSDRALRSWVRPDALAPRVGQRGSVRRSSERTADSALSASIAGPTFNPYWMASSPPTSSEVAARV